MFKTWRSTTVFALTILTAWLGLAAAAVAQVPPPDPGGSVPPQVDPSRPAETLSHGWSTTPILVAIAVAVSVAVLVAITAHRKLRAHL